jgi:hypothetical protein
MPQTQEKGESLLDIVLGYGAITIPRIIELLKLTLNQHTSKMASLVESTSWIIDDDDTIIWPSSSDTVNEAQKIVNCLLLNIDPPPNTDRQYTMTSTSIVGTPYFPANIPRSSVDVDCAPSPPPPPVESSKTPFATLPDYLLGLCRGAQETESLYKSSYYNAIEAATVCCMYLHHEVVFLTAIVAKCKDTIATTAFQSVIDNATRIGTTLMVSISDALLFPIMAAAQWCAFGVVRQCLRHGFHVDAQDSHGNSLLNMACRSKRKPFDIMCMISIIVTEGNAPVNALNKFGFAPIHFAALNASPEVVAVLLELGCNPSLCSDRPIASKSGYILDATPMDIAIRRMEICQDEASSQVMQIIWNTKYQRATSMCLEERLEELHWGMSLFVSNFGYLPRNSWTISCGRAFVPIPFCLNNGGNSTQPQQETCVTNASVRRRHPITPPLSPKIKTKTSPKKKKNIPTLRRLPSTGNLRKHTTTNIPTLRRLPSTGNLKKHNNNNNSRPKK